jgi:hypothetical protein
VQEYILELKKLIPSNVCEKIIKYYDNNFDDAGTVDDKKIVTVDKDVRNCTQRPLTNPCTFGEKIVLNYIYSNFFTVMDLYRKKHPYSMTTKISQLDILKYEANEHKAGYKYHVDYGASSMQRALSVSIALNNNFQGGEFKIKLGNEEYQYPQNVGDCLVFPSNFMFPHQVNQVTKGTRFALIGWVV